jgi:S-DNA-T family DNA segregation ATPase FtsK/SpoIIIE
MSRDRALNMPITAIFIDEIQVPLEDRTPVTVQGKKLTAGDYVGELLTWLAKKGPAAGIVLVLATQRPDSKTIPSGLRAVLGSRFALRVMDWRDSNIVLGEQMNTRGFDSSRLLPSHKGVGVLRPDGDTDAGADVLAMTVRTYYMPNEDWRTICQHGRELREAAGTLTGHANGDDTTPVLDHAAVAKAIGAGSDGDAPVPAQGPHTGSVESEASEPETPVRQETVLPETLASVVAYLSDDLDEEDSREFVPSNELVDELGVEATRFGRQMGELGCRSTRDRIATDNGGTTQIRGYLIADIRAAVERLTADDVGHATPGDGVVMGDT